MIWRILKLIGYANVIIDDAEIKAEKISFGCRKQEKCSDTANSFVNVYSLETVVYSPIYRFLYSAFFGIHDGIFYS